MHFNRTPRNSEYAGSFIFFKLVATGRVLQLILNFLILLQPCSRTLSQAIKSSSMGVVKCRTCGATVCSFRDVCFYKEGTGAWHLIVRPEKRPSFDAKIRLFRNPKPHRRHANSREFACRACNSDLGNETRAGPDGEELLCFGQRKAELSSHHPAPWAVVRRAEHAIESRTESSLHLWDGRESDEETESSNRVELSRRSAQVYESPYDDIFEHPFADIGELAFSSVTQSASGSSRLSGSRARVVQHHVVAAPEPRSSQPRAIGTVTGGAASEARQHVATCSRDVSRAPHRDDVRAELGELADDEPDFAGDWDEWDDGYDDDD